ncbi:TauD/TfdA dioxygenase family protein [Algibacillus agarilyticus]|uniref:TauD/TfdA dioxygenase family protein n=1 Tax=Algibacillus agarilyticus TaxID=2234133 RepID=UPI000DD07053|nr:TauD/TfdA family dioxygenase [Algibacillus agarilyticus]
MEIFKNDFGCELHGLNINSLTEKDEKIIKSSLYENRLVIIKNQTLTNQEYVDFANKFATPVPYLQENYHHPDHKEIFVSSNIQKTKDKMGVARTGGYWHSDTAFEQNPKVLTMLMPKVMPKTIKRTTRFIDMAKVYQAMSLKQQQTLSKMTFIHSGRWRYKVRPEDINLDLTEILAMIHAVQPPVEHPAVITHPFTKEKIIYASRGFTIEVKNEGLDQSKVILDELFDFAEQAQFIKEVTWNLGDLIIWDNRFLQHSSGRQAAVGENLQAEITKEEETMMFRITLLDGMPLCDSLRENAGVAIPEMEV